MGAVMSGSEMDANWGEFCDLAFARMFAQKLADKYRVRINIVRPGCRAGVHYVEKPMSHTFATPLAMSRVSGALVESIDPAEAPMQNQYIDANAA